MKKLILTAAIILGGLSTISAQQQPQDQSTAPTEQAAPTENAGTTETATEETGFTEIKTDEVPVAITESLSKAYPEAVLTKAFVNEKKEFQLDIKLGDKEGSLFANEDGKWIQK